MITKRGFLLCLIALALGLCLAAPAAAGSNNFIKIVNNCNNTMWFYYKCYSETPWETNVCPQDNTKNTVAPNGSFTRTYQYTSAMPCQNIHVSYGRNDRSCANCSKTLKAGFDKAMPKILTIQGECQGGSMNFSMTPQGGTILK